MSLSYWPFGSLDEMRACFPINGLRTTLSHAVPQVRKGTYIYTNACRCTTDGAKLWPGLNLTHFRCPLSQNSGPVHDVILGPRRDSLNLSLFRLDADNELWDPAMGPLQIRRQCHENGHYVVIVVVLGMTTRDLTN